MLLTKEVEVSLASNFKYYENLGYEIPRVKNKNGKMRVPKGATIIVKIEDLQKGSCVLVDTNCDCCGREKRMRYRDYNRHNHDGLTYCSDCALTVLRTGEKSHRWNPNLTDEERAKERNYPEYVDFIKRVMARDKYTCQCCGQEHGDIEVHHMDGYDWCKERRTDDTNGITLCNRCHKSFHIRFGYGNNTKAQFEEWLGKTVDFLAYGGVLPITRKVYNYEDDIVYQSPEECALELKCALSSVYKCCERYEQTKMYKRKDGTQTPYTTINNLVKGKHLFWLDKYENMTEEEIQEVIEYENNKYKKVFCITTKELFDKTTLAAKKYGVGSSAINNACLGKSKSSGQLSDGTRLQWMYYEDFLKLPQEEQNKILARNKDSSNDGSFVIHNDL